MSEREPVADDEVLIECSKCGKCLNGNASLWILADSADIVCEDCYKLLELKEEKPQ